jgi:hypothetical protein
MKIISYNNPETMKSKSLKTFSPDWQLKSILAAIDRLTILAYAILIPDTVTSLPAIGNAEASPEPDEISLKWTYSKIGLTELIYALKELGVFNNGKADLKSIAQCFEHMFSIDLGNISSAFQEILERKKGYTNITDRLREVFLKKIDSSLQG